jgi:pSer/pThr/pTyr-binding forkhead associated (FHA) protein
MADKVPSLNVLSGPLAGHRFVIEDAVDNILIGSDPSCGFVLDTPGVSPIHARLWIDLNGATIYDTNSPAGVYVNDDRVVKEAPVRNGDILWLGPPGAEGSVLIQCVLPVADVGAAAARAAPSGEDAPVDTGATMAFRVPDFVSHQPDLGSPAAGGEDDIDSTVVMSSSALMGDPMAELGDLEPTVSYPPTDATMLLDGSEGLEVVDEPTAAVPPRTPAPPAAAPTPPAPFEDFGGFPDFDVEPTVGLAPPPLPPRAAAPAARPAAPAEFEDELEPTMVDAPAPVFAEPPPVAAPTPRPAAAPLPPPVPDHDLNNEDDDAATVVFRRADEAVVAPPFAPPPAPAPPPPPTPPAAASPPTPAAPAPVIPRPPKVAAPPPSATPRPPAEARPAARVTPPAPAPPPTPAARPAAPAPRARAERPAAPAAPVVSPEATAPLRGGGSGKGALIAGGAVVVAALAFAVYWFTRPAPSTVAEATPAPPVTQAAPPVTEAAAPVAAEPPLTQAAAPPETLPPAPIAAATPAPVAAATPVPVAPAVVRSPVPSPRVAAAIVPPGQRPGQRPPAVATARPAPAGPTAAQQAAAAASNLLAQAKAAADAKNYDAAVSMYDEVLKLEPQNGPASAGRTAALAARTASRRTFVSSRTVVQTEQKSKGPAGFDTADVSVKSPDFQGRLEFAMNPPTVKPGEPYKLQIALVNEGKKPIKISGMTFTVTTNGQKSGNPIAPRVKEVAPSQRAVLEELPGVFPQANTWMAEVLVTANKGDSLKNQITWK